jgi:hypothetical protein
MPTKALQDIEQPNEQQERNGSALLNQKFPAAPSRGISPFLARFDVSRRRSHVGGWRKPQNFF